MQQASVIPIAPASEAASLLLTRLMEELCGWLDCAWGLALRVTEGAPVPLAAYGSAEDAGAVPHLVSPVLVHEGFTVMLVFGPKTSGAEYSLEEKSAVAEFGQQLARVLDDDALVGRIGATRTLQASDVRAVDYYGECRDRTPLGGAFFDFTRGTAGLTVSMGSVAAGGLSSALCTMVLRASLEALLQRHDSEAGAVVRELNRSCERLGEFYATLFCAQIFPERSELRYVNAGHEPALLVRRDGRVQRLERTGAMLGFSSHAAYGQRTCMMTHGDTLVVLGDQAAERASACDSAVARIALSNPDAASSEVCARILEAVCGNQTAVVVRIRDAAPRRKDRADYAVVAGAAGSSAARTSSQRPRPHLFLHMGRSSSFEKVAGVLHTLHQ